MIVTSEIGKNVKESTKGMALSFPTCGGHSLCDAHCRQGARVKNASAMRPPAAPAGVHASCTPHGTVLHTGKPCV